MYTTTVLNRARAKLLRQNEENEANYQAHLARAYAQLPRLREIDRSLRGTLAKLTEATFRNNGDPSAEISRLREENLRLQSERRQLVTEYLPAQRTSMDFGGEPGLQMKGRSFYGDELMYSGLTVEKIDTDFAAYLWVFDKK